MSASRLAHVKENRASILVSALSAGFGVVLIGGVNVLSAIVKHASGGELVQVPLATVSAIFFVISLYVGAIVTSNTFSTIIAGRLREIALMRLIGATSGQQRRAVAAAGLTSGAIGSLSGGLLGTIAVITCVPVLVAFGKIPAIQYPTLTPLMLLPPAVVVFTTWVASWTGSRRILFISPIQALGVAHQSTPPRSRHRARRWAPLVVAALGTTIMAFGAVLPQLFPAVGPASATLMAASILIAFAGGILSFTGILLCARFFVPATLGTIGRLLGRGPATRIAVGNATQHPERSTRMVIGLVIGVTIVSGFQVAQETFLHILRNAAIANPDFYAAFTDLEKTLSSLIAVFSVLVGFSALIAAVGLANNLSLSVLQRTREFGLLRALGFTRNQIRHMILFESVQLTLTAVGIGLLLGVTYGWAAAQSLLGAIPGARIEAPALPLPYLALILLLAALLSVAAAAAPARRALRISPVHALAAA